MLDDYGLLPGAAQHQNVLVSQTGYVQAIDTEAIGRASMLLGAGRARLETAIDLGVGMTVNAKIGDRVERDSALVTIHFNDAAGAEEAAETVRAAYTLGSEQVAPPRLIKDILR